MAKAPLNRSEVEHVFEDEGLQPHSWSNGPGDTYAPHSHEYHKVLYCLSGSIVFHTPDGDVQLRPGDGIDIPHGVEHAATVGPAGVECMEAAK